jgi:hypothetical protein
MSDLILQSYRRKAVAEGTVEAWQRYAAELERVLGKTDRKIKLAAAVLNDKGDILPYTVQSTVSQCEERSVVRWGEKAWKRLQEKGARVIQVEIAHVPTALNP